MKQKLEATFKSTVRGVALIFGVMAFLIMPVSVSAEGGAKTALSGLGIDVSGFLDMAASHNFNNPSDNTNGGRVFDVNDDAFTLHQAQLLFEREATGGKSAADRTGFALRLSYGEDARGMAPGDTDTDDEFDVQEAYITYALTDKLQAKVGKYVTLLGAEVIDSKDNLNFSRSFMFGLAIPFTHTGVRLNYAPSDLIDINIGLVNGWDTLGNDDNGTPSIEASLTLNGGNISWSQAIIYGDEPSGATQAERFVYDTIVAFDATDKLSFMVNFDYGSEQGTSLVSVGEASNWYGAAGYATYAATDRIDLTVRTEAFRDDDGARTGIDQTLYETTLTAGYKLTSSLQTRLEFRHDESSKPGFFAAGEDKQNTIAAELIFTF